MQHECPTCGHRFTLAKHTLPGCPKCVRNKMKHPNGLSPKHTAATAPPNASYIADGVNPEAIFNYMAGGSHPQESGCVLFYAPQYGSLNAVSYKPLNEIPGSGDFGGSVKPASFAVWQDIDGKCTQGPHLCFEEESHLKKRVTSGEWVPAPKCISCGVVYVRKIGDTCLNCIASSGHGAI